MANRKYITPPSQNTPCGYCYEKEATGWDHLIPVSAGGLSDWGNLIPSCKRCNSLLSNLIFKSIEAKRFYVRYRLEGYTSNHSMRMVQQEFKEETKTSEILQSKMSMEGMGSRTPKIEQQKCKYCGKKLIKIRYGQKYCTNKCKQNFYKSIKRGKIDSFCRNICSVKNQCSVYRMEIKNE